MIQSKKALAKMTFLLGKLVGNLSNKELRELKDNYIDKEEI